MTTTQNFRIENKQNIYLARRKATQFAIYKRSGDAFVFAGNFTTPGWDAKDATCLAAALEKMDAPA